MLDLESLIGIHLLQVRLFRINPKYESNKGDDEYDPKVKKEFHDDQEVSFELSFKACIWCRGS